MEIPSCTRRIIIEAVCYLYILLFVYAAVSKLIDFENFQVQLAQSPLLSAFAGWIAWMVPLAELLIALALAIARYRLVGMYAAFSLMCMFTAYIFMILNYSSFIPCSCGGILEKMGWVEHLWFNIAFIALAVLAIIIMRYARPIPQKRKKAILPLVWIAAASIAVIVILFLMSEKKMHYDNDFIRRFPDHTSEEKAMDLQFDSYYYAGTSKGLIYFGNVTAPLVVTAVDTALGSSRQVRIELEAGALPFRAPEIRIFQDDFYFIDGTVPVIYKGRIGAWQARAQQADPPDFFRYEMLGPTTIAYSYVNTGSGERNLGTTSFEGGGRNTGSNLLQKQVDGLFDVEGHLHYDALTDKVVYLYQYRNQYLVADRNLQLLSKGKTIDTISKVALTSRHVKSRNEIRLVDRPITVNQSSAVYGNLLFVQSLVRGRYEASRTWEVSSAIDVYNIKDNAYISSFYVYDKGGKKLRNFFVSHDMFYGLIGQNLVRYRLPDRILKNKLPAGTGADRKPGTE